MILLTSIYLCQHRLFLWNKITSRRVVLEPFYLSFLDRSRENKEVKYILFNIPFAVYVKSFSISKVCRIGIKQKYVIGQTSFLAAKSGYIVVFE